MRTALVGLAVVVLGACGGDDGGTPLGPDAEPVSTATPIFINRGGGEYTTGSENSRANTSSILPANAELGAYTITEPRWEALLDCLRGMYAPFDVEIVDENPGTVPHLEVVMVPEADWTSVIDQAGVGGVSPFTCAPIANAVVFMNPDLFGAEDFDICWITAQVAANAAGLDYVFSCPDVMTALDTCGDDKSFTDEDVACGETEARDCCNGQATQNSYRRLTNVYGAAR